MKRSHLIWMIIGITVLVLLTYLVPALGLGDYSFLFIFVLVMFACHLFMPHEHGGHGGHEKHGEHQHNSSSSKKTEK